MIHDMDARPIGAAGIQEIRIQLSLQPNVQFVRRLAGNVSAPPIAAQQIGDAMVVGGRTTLSLSR